MRMLLRILLRMLVVVVVLLALGWAAVAALRWQVLDEAAYAAVSRLAPPAGPPAGRNGFAALMLSDFEAGDVDAEAALAADVDRFAAWLGDDAPAAGGFEPFADRGWARRPPLANDDPRFCTLRGSGCLAAVTADPAAARAGLEAEAARLAAANAALAADHVVNPYLTSISTPVPPMQVLRLPLTAAALDAAEGRVEAAYARTCDLLTATRRFDRRASGLIEKLVAQAGAEAAAVLLLDLRRAHPVAALPDSCAEALAPVDAGEAGLCAAVRGEFRLVGDAGREFGRHLQGARPDRVLARALMFDDAVHAAWTARAMAPYCGDAAERVALAGEVPASPPPPASDSRECWAAYGTCQLLQIGMPAVESHAATAVDHAAKLRLLLAAQAVADGRATPADAAAAAGVPGQPVAFDAGTGRASVVLRRPRRDGEAAYVLDLGDLASPPP